MPYVWGGETDGAGTWFGGQEHGGYDCSGFAWRVFKLSGLPLGPGDPRAHGGRAVGRDPARGARPPADVQRADLLFFGPGRFWQKATKRRISTRASR